jgi:hypothetical protein
MFFFLEYQGALWSNKSFPILNWAATTQPPANSSNRQSSVHGLQSIKHVDICGRMTHMCVDGTARASVDYGLRCTVVSDACATIALAFGDKIYVHVPALICYCSCNHRFKQANPVCAEEIISCPLPPAFTWSSTISRKNFHLGPISTSSDPK